MADGSRSLFTINDVIVISLKANKNCAENIFLSDIFQFKYFSLLGKMVESDLCQKKLNDMAS